jgi:hypothetical protein
MVEVMKFLDDNEFCIITEFDDMCRRGIGRIPLYIETILGHDLHP